jgi:DNA-binding HxlR family transcriptional regulator
MENIRIQLKALSKRHSLELIRLLFEDQKYVSQISEETGIPYSTVQQRVAELERAGIVEVEAGVDEASKRAIKLVRLVNFRIELTPRVIQKLVTGEDHRELRIG